MASIDQFNQSDDSDHPSPEDANSADKDDKNMPPIYSLVESAPSEKKEDLSNGLNDSKIPKYAMVDKSVKKSASMSRLRSHSSGADLMDGSRPLPALHSMQRTLPLSVKPYVNTRVVRTLNAADYATPYVNVTTTSAQRPADKSPNDSETTSASRPTRFSGVLQWRGLGAYNGPSNPVKTRHTFFRERWASILAVVLIAVMFIYVTVLFAESVRAKSQQCSDVNGSIQRYLNQVQPVSYSVATLDKQLGLLMGAANSSISSATALEQLFNKYSDKLDSYDLLIRSSAFCRSEGNPTHPLNGYCYKVLSQMYSINFTAIVELNMKNNSSSCPDGLTLSNMAGLRTCQRRSGMGCSSVLYPVNISYSRVFGRIKAYQYGPTNSFQMFRRGNGTIDEPYVDGVSLTYGSPRKHIWTFAADRDKNNSFCPCVRDDISTPEFVGEDYFCDTGEAPDDTLAVNNPLWDGSGCDQTYSCCIYKNPPWFYKQLPYPTSDPIELRVCGDQGASGENIALEQIYLYVIN